MIEIDGSFGEGGGQILRTALSLSLIFQKPIKVFNLRAKRANPGLRAQHLCAVKSAINISGSQVQGAEIGSKEIVFYPSQAKAGRYKINIGTAGSTSLVFQTLLPVLLLQNKPSELEIIGGTHNPKSPSFEFIAGCLLPLLKNLGIEVEAKIYRFGFYPKGGGRVWFKIFPWKNRSQYLKLIDRINWKIKNVDILLAGLAGHIADRERAELVKRLKIESEKINLKFLPSDQGPGNAIVLRLSASERTEIFTGYGQPGKRAERVAQELAREVKNFIKSRAQLDSYLADQLLIYLILGKGGEFTTNYLSSHFHTNLAIIKRFIKVYTEVKSFEADLHWVKIIPEEEIKLDQQST